MMKFTIVELLIVLPCLFYVVVYASLEDEQNAMVSYLNKNNYLHGKSEIVFLLDRSGSIGAANFEAEKGFVESFLTHVVVDANATRVAVISYSDTAERHIDYLKEPKTKCFLAQELQDVIFKDSKATNIAAALEEARLVFLNARPNVNKVLILVSDGFHTKGGNPVPYADALKASGVQIFCFGIGRFLKTELQKLASSIQHLYSCDGFSAFKRLARKIRGDQHEISWTKQDTKRNCDHLCDSPYKGEPDDPGCCDHVARCSCALLSGIHTCVCGPGYYGLSALAGHCKACPRGTYKSNIEPSLRCISCSANSTTAEVASTSIKDCYCKEGYYGDPSKGVPCTLIKCPPLQKPTHGTVLEPCYNTYGSSCHFMCDDGYEIVDPKGDFRTCEANGEWSGKTTVCQEIHCFPILTPINSVKKCEFGDPTVGKKCSFQCDRGYIMKGSRERECLSNKKWSGSETKCLPIECSIPPSVKNGRHTCQPNQKVKYSFSCAYSCNDGFKLNGPKYLICDKTGALIGLSGEEGSPYCEDVQPPELKCPQPLNLTTSKGMERAFADWEVPQPIDNSGNQPKIFTVPRGIFPKSWFLIGNHKIIYEAIDSAGLKTDCVFTINVLDKEPPTLLKCPENVKISSSDIKTSVEWEEPIFSDNSGNKPTIKQTAYSGDEFNIGSHEVMYIAQDRAGNREICEFKVFVSQTTCPYYPPPVNGAFVCNDWMYGKFCQAYCNEKYDFSEKIADWYVCTGEAQWTTVPNNMPIPWPDCSQPVLPSKVRQILKAYQYIGDCNDPQVKLQLQKKLLHQLTSRFRDAEICVSKGNCLVKAVNVSCGRIKSISQKRNRRNAWNHAQKEEIVLEFEITINANQELNDTNSILQDFMETIRKLDWNLEDTVEATTMSLVLSNENMETGVVEITDSKIELICKPGSILSDKLCVLCPSGTFYDEHLKECSDCPLGQYQENEGEFGCVRCHFGTSTEFRRSRNKTECKGICPPGSYSSSGLQTCIACPTGTYQEYVGQTSCIMCPNGTTTANFGSTDVEDCKVVCEPGTYSLNGLFPCKLCPKSYYQPLFGATSCVECPTNFSTIIEGSIELDDCIDIDPCLNDTFCLNDSACHRNGRKAVCLCKEGFEGEQCTDDKNECLDNPCFNDALCVNTVGSFYCKCLDGFGDDLCDIEIDECESFPCMNNASCLDKVNGYVCLCPFGYVGLSCEIEQEICFRDIICLNGGECIFRDENTSSCLCAPGYEGIDCSTNIDDCKNVTCQHNGSCTDGVSSYSCKCASGYYGSLCEYEINECETNLCQGGSTCEDHIGFYKCLCPPGWNGTYCDNKMDSNFVLMFPDTNATIANMATMTLPSPLLDATVSLWVQTSDTERSGTPFSYAVASASISDSEQVMDNALTISDCSGLQIYVNNQPIMTNLQVADGKWHHLAFSWQNSGAWSLYKDGELQSQGTGLNPGAVIQKGGLIVIGQEQDEVGGGFSPFETFAGNISRLNVWNSYFSNASMIQLCNMDDDIPGKIVAWPDFLHNLQGDVQVLNDEKPVLFQT